MKYPHTPIRIYGDIVLAWVWNGRERDKVYGTTTYPVFRLKKPKAGMWRNGRVLQIPFREKSYVTKTGE